MDSTDSSERPLTTENTGSVKEQLADCSEEKIYEYFSQTAWNMQEIVESFEVLKEKLGLSKKVGLELYRGLKMTLGSPNSKAWKARDMMNLLEKRANQKEYMQQKASTDVRVFIIGAGPIGLRLAIDCVLLGAEVVVVEKRKTFSRNNVLHLWPFTIEDLRQLGAKKFYGKFCAGAIDHISIRSLQCILLKVALMIGVKFYSGIEFLEIQEPDDQIGWHARLNPSDHPLNLFEFDVLAGADGARKSRVPGFDRKELRGKLALAITANFRNYYTREEAAIQEISGVAFIFNQKFFKDLKEDTDIDLENIVYYKDDTHYFVMTAKKDSLLRKGVLMADYPDTAQLLHPNNIHMENLYDYSREAAAWCTDLPKLDFAQNHYKKNDVALFDFTSIHQAENAATAINRKGKDLYLCLVGDALLEPFWPTGTGCARGFLSAMDTAWLVKRIGQKKSVLEVLCEREGIFQRLPQTTPESLISSIKSYTINPKTRYPNLHLHNMRPANVVDLYDTEETLPSPAALRHASVKVKRSAEAAGMEVPVEPVVTVASDVKIAVSSGEEDKENRPTMPAEKKRKEDLKPSLSVSVSPRKRSLKSRGSIHLAYYADPEEEHGLNDPDVLLKWLQRQVEGHGVTVTNLTSSWSNGMALCALIYHYHPQLIPDFKKLSPKNVIENNELAFSVAEESLGISRMLKPKEMKKPDKLTLLSYLSQFYNFFQDAEPAPPPSDEGEAEPMVTEASAASSTPKQNGGVAAEETPSSERRDSTGKKVKRKRSLFRRSSKKKLISPSPSSASWNTKTVKRDGTPTSPPVTKTTPGATPLTTIQEKPPADSNTTPKLTRTKTPTTLGFKPPSADSSDFCYFCNKRVYLMERMSANGVFFHRTCFKCSHCNCQLKIGGYSLSKGVGDEKGKFFCSAHYRQLFLSNPEAINYSRAGGAGAKPGEGSGEKAGQERGMAKIEEEEVPEEKMETEKAEEEVVKEKKKKKKSKKKGGDKGRRESTPSSATATTDEELPVSSVSSVSPVSPVSPASSEDNEEKPKKPSLGQRLRSWSMGSRSRPKSKSRSSSEEPEEVKSSTEDEHRQVAQVKSGSTTPRSAPQSPHKEQMEVEQSPVKLRSHTVSSVRQTQSGLVQRLSMGFEKLEANARETEIQLGAEGRERAKSQLFRQSSGSVPQPFQMANSSSLSVIQEASRGRGLTVEASGGAEARAPRARSPARWRGTLQSSRTHIEEVQKIQRGSSSITRKPQRGGRGQRSVSRPLIDNYETSDVAIQERRKQQRRFRDAQLIQREMSQLERQYDELEEVGRQIEQALRDAEDTKQEDNLMKSWLSLVNERNGLVRKTSELSLRMKELELEDRQYEVDKKLNALTSLLETVEMEGEDLEDFNAKFEDLCNQKVKIVEERNELVEQTEEERQRELEEDNALKPADSESDEEFEVLPSSSNGAVPTRRCSAPAKAIKKAKDEPAIEKEQKRKSWWNFGKS